MYKVDWNTVGKRLTLLWGELEIKSSRQFAMSVNIDPSYFSKAEKGDGLSMLQIQSIVDKYHVNKDWLLYGNGDMFGANKDKVHKTTSITHAPAGKFPKKIGLGHQPVPYYDVDFAAGDIELYDDKNALQPAYMMDIPEFSGCTAFRVFSNSMERLIVSGSILFGTKVEEWKDHIEFGQIYGIVCNDKRRYLKYIRKAGTKDETHFLLRSENVEEFDDFLMPKNKIKSIWLIHGWLNKRN